MQYTTTLALALAVASTAAFPAKRQAAAACAPVHLIVARASGEDPGEGIIGAVSQDIQARVPGADAEAVEYPAALVPYQASEAEGVAEMTRLVTEYAAACPDSKMVLMGYSQGGQVALDTLCGTSSVGFEVTEPVAGDVAEKVAAVVVMGEPTFIAGEPYTVGSATNDGTFPRVDTESCLPFADRMQSFCDSGDTFCDSGNSLLTHLGYVQAFGDDAADFVVGLVGEDAAAVEAVDVAADATAIAVEAADATAAADVDVDATAVVDADVTAAVVEADATAVAIEDAEVTAAVEIDTAAVVEGNATAVLEADLAADETAAAVEIDATAVVEADVTAVAVEDADNTTAVAADATAVAVEDADADAAVKAADATAAVEADAAGPLDSLVAKLRGAVGVQDTAVVA